MPSEVFLQPYLSSDLGSVWLLPELGLLYLSSDLGGVWLFRIHGRGAAFKRLSRLGCAMFLVYALGLFSSFLFLVGSKGAVLDPPNVLFFAVPELESCWGSAVSEPCFWSTHWGSFLLFSS